MSHTTCLISGGGPAGMMLGLLLARGGVAVTVLEKHADFLRDFRGDTVHASTLQLIDELGLAARFAAIPQSRLTRFDLPAPDGSLVQLADFTELPGPYNYIAMTPQWDFLDLLADAAREEPTFTLEMSTEVTGLREDQGVVKGVTWQKASGETGETDADLVVACDGRGSILRDAANLFPREFDVPFDVWWFRLPRRKDEEAEISGLIPTFMGRDIILSIAREGFFQIAYFIPKGTDAERRADGISAFRETIARVRPDFADRVDSLKSMDDIKTLDVHLNRLEKWHRPGLLLLGDAAHAMSPAGGVGVNLAIQDAVAAARILRQPLLDRAVSEHHLNAIRRRRWMPTVIIQSMQRVLHRLIFQQGFQSGRVGPPEPVLFLSRHFPWFRRLPSRLIAIGPRPERAPQFARRKANAS